MNDGFRDFISGIGDAVGVDSDWESVHLFRQRYMIEAMAKSRG